MKKVLLVIPPAIRFTRRERKYSPLPLGALYVASYISNDFDVKVLDCISEDPDNEIPLSLSISRYGLSNKEIIKRIKEFAPHFIGVSNLFTAQSSQVYEMCHLAKKINPDIITILGGPNPTVLYEEFLKTYDIDFIVQGEGEVTFLELLQHIAQDKIEPLSKIAGIAYRRNGKITTTQSRPPIENLDTIPFPAHNYVDIERYKNTKYAHGLARNTPSIPLITSRGCPNLCSYCLSRKVWGNYRFRTFQNVIQEMELLIEKYGIREFRFDDDSFDVSSENIKRLLNEIINRKLNIKWGLPNGISPNILSRDTLSLMKESGCRYIYLAIESPNERVLKEIANKSINLNSLKNVVNTAKEIGIDVYAFLMIGFPGEKKSEILNTISFARSLKLTHAVIFNVIPFPGTKLAEIVKANQYQVKKDRKYFRYARAIMKTDDFSPRFLESLRAKSWLLMNYWDKKLYHIYFYKRYFESLIYFIIDFWQFIFYKLKEKYDK